MITREQYYSNPFIQQYICNQLINRECAFIKKVEDDKDYMNVIRCIKAFMPKYLIKNFERWEFFKRDYNIYQSLSSYHDFPMLSFNLSKRLEEQRALNKLLDEDYKENNNKLISGYDFAIDIDAENLLDAIPSTRKIKEIFDEYKLPYILKCSGNAGFHFNIPDKYWLSGKSIKEKHEMNLLIAKNLKEAFDIKEIDLAGIYSYRRLWKIGLSWDVVSDLIAIPLDDEMFNSFSIEMCKPEWVLSNLKLFKQDMFIRKGDAENVNKFIKDYGVD